MAMFGAMGNAVGGMMGGGAKAAMGGGNGGSFAQKQNLGGGGMAQKFAMAQQKRPQFAQQQPGMRMGQQMRPQVEPRQPIMGGGIGPRMGGGGMPPPFMQRQPMPEMPQGNGPYNPSGPVMRPQVQGPNGESPNQQQGGGLAEMFRKMQMQQQQGGGYRSPMQGGGQMDPRFQTMGRGIAPQLSMMPQMMQQPRQPNPYGAGYGEEEMY